MNSPGREEIDAKLLAVEARQDARVVSIESKIDNLISIMNERSKATDERMSRLEYLIVETGNYVRNLKSTVITTGIATGLATALGIAAFNATVLSNMVASFESGKNTAAAQAEVKRQSEETAALLRQIQKSMPSKAAPATPKMPGT